SIGAQHGQQWSPCFISLPIMPEGAKQDVGGVQRIELRQVTVGQPTGFSRAFGEAIVLFDSSKIVVFRGIFAVDIAKERCQFVEHHSSRAMHSTSLETKPEPG